MINSNREWADICSGSGSSGASWFSLPSTEGVNNRFIDATMGMAALFFLMLFAWLGSFAVKSYRRRSYIRLHGEEVSKRYPYIFETSCVGCVDPALSGSPSNPDYDLRNPEREIQHANEGLISCDR